MLHVAILGREGTRIFLSYDIPSQREGICEDFSLPARPSLRRVRPMVPPNNYSSAGIEQYRALVEQRPFTFMNRPYTFRGVNTNKEKNNG